MGDPEGTADVAEDPLPGLRELVVGLGLIGRKLMHERSVAHLRVGEAVSEVAPQAFQVLAHQLHRRDAAGGDLVHEPAHRRKRRPPAPEPEARSVGQVVDLRCGRRAYVDDPSVWKEALELEARQGALSRFPDAALALSLDGISHAVALIEHDDALEGLTRLLRVSTCQPPGQLLNAVDADGLFVRCLLWTRILRIGLL